MGGGEELGEDWYADWSAAVAADAEAARKAAEARRSSRAPAMMHGDCQLFKDSAEQFEYSPEKLGAAGETAPEPQPEPEPQSNLDWGSVHAAQRGGSEPGQDASEGTLEGRSSSPSEDAAEDEAARAAAAVDANNKTKNAEAARAAGQEPSAQAVEELQRAEELQRSISALLKAVGYCSKRAQQRQEPMPRDSSPPPAFLMKKLTEELATLTARTQSVAPKNPSGDAWMDRECNWAQPKLHTMSGAADAETSRVSRAFSVGPGGDAEALVDDGEWVALRSPPSSLSSLGFRHST